MKRLFSVLLVAMLAVPQANCERDDVCSESTPTTPRIVIEFYDYTTQTDLKNVTNLGVQAVDSETLLTYTGVSKIYVPLKTFDTSTTLNFTLNNDENPDTPTFTDKLQFNYTTREIYVSRACGYKTVFDLSQQPGVPAVILNDGAPYTWMRNIIIDTYTIEFENETHIRIYF